MKQYLQLLIPKIWVLAILLTVGFAFSTPTWGQLLLEENFDYPAGDSLNQLHGWVVQPTASYVNTIKVASPGLIYTNYPSAVGNSVMIDTTGQDIYHTFTSQASGSMYASFLVNIIKATTTGDYFFHFTESAGSTTFRGRVFAKLSGSDVVFGLLKGSTGTANYTTATYGMNTTHLIVLKYTFNSSSTTDDSVYLFINPQISAVEPMPDLGYGSTDADFTGCGLINLRQGTNTNAPRLTLDGIRVSTSWSEIFPPPPTYNVTFLLNTSVRLDTIVPTSMVQIRGNTAPLTWGDDSPLMTNIGGDYWEVTHSFPEGTNLEVQYYATDWEGVGNTAFTVTQDTVLPLRYYKRGFNNPPYTPSDSVDVWFRVNVAGVVGFDPATQQVGIRGSLSPLDWGATYLLAQEGTSMFYSGVAKFHPDSARNVYYKFYIENGAGWEPSGDNIFPMKNDTTLVWKWYGDLRPPDQPITENNIEFRADIAELINSNGFNPATDSLKILIFAGGAIIAGNQKMEEDISQAGLFTTTLTIKAAIGSEVKYKFKAYPDERFENGGGYETGSDRIYVWAGVDSILPIAFPTIIPKAAGLPHDVTIKFIVDMRSPIYDSRTTLEITNLRDVWIKGGAAPLGAWGGNWTYDDTTAGTLIKFFDDGTMGDLTAGDGYWSRDLVWLAGTPGGTFEFKFAAGYPGVEGGGSYYLDNEAGYGSNHTWSFPSVPPTTATLRMRFAEMGTVSVRDINAGIPENYSLSQNYPNPFNPTTKIDFSLPVSGLVTLKVFNILGQEVATLMNSEMKAGNYSVDFDASKLSSGVYFYKLQAGSFVQTNKLSLIK
jgi:hypothetical protein